MIIFALVFGVIISTHTKGMRFKMASVHNTYMCSETCLDNHLQGKTTGLQISLFFPLFIRVFPLKLVLNKPLQKDRLHITNAFIVSFDQT